MRTLETIVDYNTILFSFVDSLSVWDHFVSPYIRQYFEEQYGLTEEDLQMLQLYTTTRAPLEWNGQGELYAWAHAGFPDRAEYSELIKVIRHFEHKLDTNGRTLHQELEQARQELQKLATEINQRFAVLDINHYIRKFLPLFEIEEQFGILPFYLVYSPSTKYTQGGANGEMIYVQCAITMDENLRQKKIKVVSETALHEFLHKELNTYTYFHEKISPELSNFYNTPNIKGYPDSVSGLVEEALIHNVSEILILGYDLETTRKNNFGVDSPDPERRRSGEVMFKATEAMNSVVLDFYHDRIDRDEAIQRIHEYFLNLAEADESLREMARR